MTQCHLLHHLIERAARLWPTSEALVCRAQRLDYAQLAALQQRVAAGLVAAAVQPGARVGIYLSKTVECVATAFGSSCAGAVFVPINPVLKSAQVAHILNDCAVDVLVTSPERLAQLRETLDACPALRVVVSVSTTMDPAPAHAHYRQCSWDDFIAAGQAMDASADGGSDSAMAAILYTSGSTGKPKGVMVNHRNLVSGATSVASYLQLGADDRILGLLPLSFDAGFSQLTTGFHTGACVVLLDFLLPDEALAVLDKERITSLTAVPPLWIQLAALPWPVAASQRLRSFANTGGRMPAAVLAALRVHAPNARPYLMYGLTEAFRSTYLPPDQVDARPDSIGRAIPNQEILVLRPDGRPCAPDEPGELVHRGSTVSLGYWNDPARTDARFRPLPGSRTGLVLPEYVVFSGDMVRRDAEGYLYFIGRNDEMIKSSGYRISPAEVEEALYATGMVMEAAAMGVPDAVLGQTVAVVVLPFDPPGFDPIALQRALTAVLPHYMVPKRIDVSVEALPRNGNGKIDRRLLLDQLSAASVEVGA